MSPSGDFAREVMCHGCGKHPVVLTEDGAGVCGGCWDWPSQCYCLFIEQAKAQGREITVRDCLDYGRGYKKVEEQISTSLFGVRSTLTIIRSVPIEKIKPAPQPKEGE